MNRNQLTNALSAFLDDESLQVAALSGDWGVGKTYFWREYATSHDLPDMFNGSSYASVFGADSLEEIRTRIAAGMELSKDRKFIAERYSDEADKLLMPRDLPRKALGFLELLDSYRRGELTKLASQAGYWFVRDCLVCLDDIERLGTNVDSRALMGVIDELRERNCKVVLLLNRDQVPKDDKAFQQYWEKIVDIDLVFVPDIETNVSVAFEDLNLPIAFRAAIGDVFKQLDCRNIRIHRRARGLVKAVVESTFEAPEPIRKTLVEHSALFAWALLDADQDLSDQVITSEQYNSLWIAVLSQGGARDRLSAEEEAWAKVIEQTGFQPLPFDQYLAGYIRTGWLDVDGLRSSVQVLQENVDASASQTELSTVLRAYGDDFQVTQQQYVDRLRGTLNEGLEHLTVFDFDNGLSTLSMLNEETQELAQAYAHARGDHLQKVAEAPGRNRRIIDPVLRDEVNRRETEFQATRFTIDGVAHDLTGPDGWGRNQIDFLASQSVEAYVDWMRSSPTDLLQKVRAILDFRGQDEAPYPQVVARLEDALRVIARESEFNAERIRTTFGVEPQNEEGAN